MLMVDSVYSRQNSFSHFLFRKMMSNIKQTKANSIPKQAKVLKVAVSPILNVSVMLIGVPSDGGPPACIPFLVVNCSHQ